MYTHKITSKLFENNILVIGVEFTDGTTTFTETVKPQDEAGLKYWLKQRLSSLNSITTLSTIALNSTLDLESPEVDTRTQAEKDRDAWLVKYNRWVSIKNNLIDTGVVPANNPQAVAFLDDVKAGFKQAYINFI